ncbi:MAG: hypothetical protein HY216_09185 [Candidatus Rokubacteria bacterium]|nr:hypothetical protein [Candidatus Rokubacteria bacterium]
MRSPLDPWLDARTAARLRRRRPPRPRVFAPRDSTWRDVAPDFAGAVALARAGLAFQVAVEQRYDRSGDPRRLPRALAAGATVYFPQVHQALPRVARLMVALRAGVLGPRGEACSFLFAVEGRGRVGLGLHHDGNVDSVWLQLEGRRTVTTGPPVPRGTPADLDPHAPRRGPGWVTRDLAPGSLFYLPPRTPHDVVCHGRSLAISLTFAVSPARPPRALTAWDVVEGRVDRVPPVTRDRLWTQVPAVAGPLDRARRAFPLWLPDGTVRLPAAAHAFAARLAVMPSLTRADARRAGAALEILLAHGILAPQDLPRVVRPANPRALDGWRFA